MLAKTRAGNPKPTHTHTPRPQKGKYINAKQGDRDKELRRQTTLSDGGETQGNDGQANTLRSQDSGPRFPTYRGFRGGGHRAKERRPFVPVSSCASPPRGLPRAEEKGRARRRGGKGVACVPPWLNGKTRRWGARERPKALYITIRPHTSSSGRRNSFATVGRERERGKRVIKGCPLPRPCPNQRSRVPLEGERGRREENVCGGVKGWSRVQVEVHQRAQCQVAFLCPEATPPLKLRENPAESPARKTAGIK